MQVLSGLRQPFSTFPLSRCTEKVLKTVKAPKRIWDHWQGTLPCWLGAHIL